MRILDFRIENFRNLRLAECNPVSDFMLICGANGCGKSALLEALIKGDVGSKTTYDSRNRFNMVHYKMFLFA